MRQNVIETMFLTLQSVTFRTEWAHIFKTGPAMSVQSNIKSFLKQRSHASIDSEAKDKGDDSVSKPSPSSSEEICCEKSTSSSGHLPEYPDIGKISQSDLSSNETRRSLLNGKWDNMFHFQFPQR